ncbi:MAG: nucleotidyltransferase family protein [Thermodesulfobacteriota bacterium]|nr:nucleotidyltransferase family protein [Thermodesulfobacteriota bacterium]
MRGVGVITEYNPFHNGHLYHVQQARQCSGADVVVAVMSGHFLQRGEPALVDKWTRAQMALHCGVDVVVELPLPYACNSAPLFARGAIQVLDFFAPHLDCVCFGSESGNLPQLHQLAAVMAEYDSAAVDSHHLRCGQTFPQARAAALAKGGHDISLLNQPNNILSLAYLRAIEQLGSDLRPLTITRRGAGYHDLTPGAGGIASATAIRHRLVTGEPVQPYMPEAAYSLLAQAVKQRMTVGMSRWFAMVEQVCLSADRLAGECYQMEPGLAERIFQAALVTDDFDDLVTRVKARHLTRTRVQRLLCYLVVGMKADEVDNFLSQPIPYVQLLGTSRQGELFLRQCRNDFSLPLISNFSRIHTQLNRTYGHDSPMRKQAEWLVEMENRATRLYTLLLPGWQGKSRQWNYFQQPCRV